MTGGTASMAQSPELLPLLKLSELARVYPAQALPVGTHQSYPVPVAGPRGLQIGFLYCRAMITKPDEGYQLWPPSYLASLDAINGKFIELKAVQPKELGQSHPEDKPIGRYLSPPERSAPEFLSKLVRWYQAYDALLPLFLEGVTVLPPPAREAATQFKALFAGITEAPLQPYYRAVGAEFFAWLDGLKL